MASKPFYKIKAVLFDFGGVIAEEGFLEGLKAIARKSGLPPMEFFKKGHDAVYATGYVTGNASETDFWKTLRLQTGIMGRDDEFRKEILNRFILRSGMLKIVDDIKSQKITVGILSDQTDWLDILEKRHHFFKHFDIIFNSYHLGRSKKEPGFFDEVRKSLGLKNENILFVDDNDGNTERAQSRGFRIHLFTNEESLKVSLFEAGILKCHAELVEE